MMRKMRKMRKWKKQMLSVLLSLSVAGGVYLPASVSARALSASVYPVDDEDISYNQWASILVGIKEKISKYAEEQNLTVKEISICQWDSYNKIYNKFYENIHPYSILIAYDSEECPQVETAIREYMKETGIAEEYVCFYNAGDKIKDRDVIYTMLFEYVKENDIAADVFPESAYHHSMCGHSECNNYVNVRFLACDGVGEVISRFIAENNIDATQVGYEVLDLAEPDPELTMGDANEDGEVDISDVVLMNRVYVGVDRISKQGLANADTDGDGKITLTDSMNVLRYLVHLIDEL